MKIAERIWTTRRATPAKSAARKKLKKIIDRFEIFDTYQNALGKFPDEESDLGTCVPVKRVRMGIMVAKLSSSQSYRMILLAHLFLFDIEAAFNKLQQMTHKQFSSKGGKTMTEKRKESLAISLAKARAALAKKRRESK